MVRFLITLVVSGSFSLSVALASPFEEDIRPILKSYCYDCHGPDKQKADLNFATLDTDLIEGSDADMWQEVLDLVNISEMPPTEELQPSTAERQTLVNALTAELRRAMERERSSGGRNVMRRLTAYEYNKPPPMPRSELVRPSRASLGSHGRARL